MDKTDSASELRRKALELLEQSQEGQAQVYATLAMGLAVEELTSVVRLMAPTVAPDPDAGQGYQEFELQAEGSLELDVPKKAAAEQSVEGDEIELDVDVDN